jgi:two-component system, NtrC family, response regulator AtoC
VSTRPRLLIVEDEPDAAAALKELLEARGYDVRIAATAAKARVSHAEWQPDLVLMDLMLPDTSGLELLREIKDSGSPSEVIMVSGFGSIPKVVEAMNGGALSFVEKPIDMPLLFAKLDKAREILQLAQENQRLREELGTSGALGGLLARSEAMRQVVSIVRKVAPTDASILIHGESGTGKEVVATAVHQLSQRARAPFIKINCAAIPHDLIESELFGHQRGSFTGAIAERVGLLELADGGSVLFDEIGEMPANLQVKLLRVLQERAFRPVGSSRLVKSDFRLICATNADLDAALKDRTLRQDLYFRINTVTIRIPALRERPEDIAPLVDHFIARYAEQHDRQVDRCAPDALRALQRYRWPGNVRELEHAIERAVIVATGSAIRTVDLPFGTNTPRESASTEGFVIPPHHTLEEIERLAIAQTLARTHGNKRAAASILGVYRPTLYSKMRKYNLGPVGDPQEPARGD